MTAWRYHYGIALSKTGRVSDMQQDPIDLSQLDDLLAGAGDVNDILHELLTQSRIDLVELENALGKQDIPEVVRVAHRIKGAGRMVGANQLASICEAMEQEGKQGRLKFEAEAKSELMRLLAWLDARLNPATSARTANS